MIFSGLHPGNLLFVDTDTIFLQKVAPLFQIVESGQYVFHELEGTIGGGQTLLLRNIRRHFEKPWIKKQYFLPPETPMYNSGLIGLTSHDLPLVQEVKKTTDILYGLQKKNVMEQLAFNIHLNGKGTIFSATDYVLHYWPVKKGISENSKALFFHLPPPPGFR